MENGSLPDAFRLPRKKVPSKYITSEIGQLKEPAISRINHLGKKSVRNESTPKVGQFEQRVASKSIIRTMGHIGK